MGITQSEQIDVTTLEGVQEFVELVKEETGQLLFKLKALMPTCYLFVLEDSHGNKLDAPAPMLLPPTSEDWKGARGMVRKCYLKFNAVGVLRIHNEGRRILLQLEHKELGDLVWYTTSDETHMLGKLFGPVALTKLEFPELKVLPARYMS